MIAGPLESRVRDIATLREGFRNPPREAGPWVYWMFFDNVMSCAEITRELEEMAAAGIAGAEIRFLSLHGFSGTPGPGFDRQSWSRLGQQRLEFLSPEFVRMLEHACGEAQRLGLRLAINLGMGWPPGGPWITPEHRSKHLVACAEVIKGPQSLHGDHALPVPSHAMIFTWRLQDDDSDGKEVQVDSFRDLSSLVDSVSIHGSVKRRGSAHVFGPCLVLTAAVDAEKCANPPPTRERLLDSQGRLEWHVPAGRWLIGIFHYAAGGLCDKGNGPEADPGSREAMLFHLNYIFDRLQPNLERYFGSTLAEVASDSWEYERRRDGRYWSPGIFDLFPEMVGYDLRNRMHALLGYGPDREGILEDLDSVERELIRRNFYETTTAYLHARGLRHRPQVRGRGLSRDFFEAFAESDVPEIEEEVFLPEAVWTAHTLGQPIVSAEAFTFLSGHRRNLEWDGQQRLHEGPLADAQREWETNPALLRWHANAHFARGVNRIQMHSFGYSPLGLPPPGWRIYAEVHLNRNVPWWPSLRLFSTWSARSQWLLQSGKPVADALVYPVKSNSPEGPYNLSTDQPASALNAVDGASPYTLARLQSTARPEPYDCLRVVLTNDVSALDEAQSVLQLVDRGSLLVCCHSLPDDWTALQARDSEPEEIQRLQNRFREIAQRGMLQDARGRDWREIVDETRSVRWHPATAQLSFQHRRVQGGEVYYLTNWGEDFAGQVSFPHMDSTPEIWEPDTGMSLPAAQYHTDQDRTSLFLMLGSHESTFVVFTQRAAPLHAVQCEGGHVERDPDGGISVRPSDNQPCHVRLSDGRTQEVSVAIPDPIALEEGWRLVVDPGRGVGIESAVSLDLVKLRSWHTVSELRTFAGIASYQTDFQIPATVLREDVSLTLELGEVYELADVWLNGHHAGTSWFPPHRLDVTHHAQPGRNSLRVDIPNILKNHLEPGKTRRPSGLLGPVRIRPVGRVRIPDAAP